MQKNYSSSLVLVSEFHRIRTMYCRTDNIRTESVNILLFSIPPIYMYMYVFFCRLTIGIRQKICSRILLRVACIMVVHVAVGIYVSQVVE